MASKITRWLLLVLVLSLGLGQLLRFEQLGLPLYFHDLVVVGILLLNLKRLPEILSDFKVLKLFCLGLFISWLAALYLYPPSTLLLPALYSLRLVAYLTLFFLVKRGSYRLPRPIFIASGMVMVTIGLAQYLLLPDMRWAQYLGWDDHLNRLTLPHYDPTFTGVMLGLFVLSLLHNMRYSVFVIPITIALLLTYARSVWLSLLFTMTLFIKNTRVLILGICCLLLAVLALPDRFGEGTNLLRTFSITSRVESDLGYLKRYGWSLVVGRGLNTLVLEQTPSTMPNHATGPNNSYLYLLTTTGILGLIGWALFLRYLYLNSRHKPMLTFFFIASLFNNVMFYPYALLWVLLIDTNN